MVKKNKYFLATTVICASVVLCGAALVAGKALRFGPSFTETTALEYNTLDFDIRNEDGAYSYTKEYTEKGLELHVNSGDWQGYKFGLVNWDFPVESNKTYYCEFFLTANVAGSEAGGGDFSEVALECGPEGGRTTNWIKNFVQDEEFTASVTFDSGDHDTTAINLQLGGLRTAAGENKFDVSIHKFVIKEGDVNGDIVHRVNFESAGGFAERWLTSHGSKDFCDEDADSCREMIYDFCALRAPARNVLVGEAMLLDGLAETFVYDEGGTISTATNMWYTDEGLAVHFENKESTGEVWRTGMLVNTGIPMLSGYTYDINLTVSTWNSPEGYEVILQNQRDANPETGRYEYTSDYFGEFSKTVTPGETNKGTLWILVQAGNSYGEVTIANVKVTIHEAESKYTIMDSINYFADRYNIVLG